MLAAMQRTARQPKSLASTAGNRGHMGTVTANPIAADVPAQVTVTSASFRFPQLQSFVEHKCPFSKHIRLHPGMLVYPLNLGGGTGGEALIPPCLRSTELEGHPWTSTPQDTVSDTPGWPSPQTRCKDW